MNLKYNVEIPDQTNTGRKAVKQKIVLEFYKSGNKTAEILDFTDIKTEYFSIRSVAYRLNVPVQVILRENRLFLKRKDMQ